MVDQFPQVEELHHLAHIYLLMEENMVLVEEEVMEEAVVVEQYLEVAVMVFLEVEAEVVEV